MLLDHAVRRLASMLRLLPNDAKFDVSWIERQCEQHVLSMLKSSESCHFHGPLVKNGVLSRLE